MNRRDITPQTGKMIVITDRKVSDKIQPDVKKGNFYVVSEVTQLKSGATCLICHRKSDKKIVRINEERFNWLVVTQEDIERAERKVRAMRFSKMVESAEKQYQEKVSESVRDMVEAFTDKECVQIVFVPLVIVQMALIYAEKAKRYSTDNRISEMRSVSRNMEKIKEDWEKLLSRDLDRTHRENIKQQTEEFLACSGMQQKLNVFYFTLCNEFNRQYPDVTHVDLRIYAHIVILIILAYERHNRKMDRMIIQRLGKGDSKSNPLITSRLYAQMKAYCSDFILDHTTDMSIFEKSFDNTISAWEFEAVVTQELTVKNKGKEE